MKLKINKMPVSLGLKIEEDYYLIKATEIEMKPLWIRWLCVHNFTGGVRKVYDNKGRKRHAYICLKCGKRDYID